MTRFIKTAGTIILAALACFVMLFGLMFITKELTIQSRLVADFLPANNTVAVFHKPSQEDLKKWIPLFPNLSVADLSEPIESIAIIDVIDGQAIAIFTKEDPSSPEWFEKNGTIVQMPPFTILIDQPNGSDILTDRENSLSLLNGYTQLKSLQQPDTHWMYLVTEKLSTFDNSIDSLLQHSIFSNASHASITQVDAGIDIHIISKSPTRSPSIAMTQPILLENSIVHISGYNLATIAKNNVLNHKILSSPSAKAIAQTQLLSLFGDTISLQYELPDLLTEEATVEVNINGSGTLLYGLQSSSKKPEEVKKLFEKMHKGYTNNQKTTEIRSIQLNDQFQSTDIKISKNKGSSPLKEQVEDWEVTVTNSNTDVLVTAVKNNNYIISNDPSLVSRLNNLRIMSLPIHDSVTQSSPTLGGSINLRQLPTLLTQVFGIQYEEEPAAFLPTEGIFTWSYDSQGKIQRLRIEKRY